MKPIEFEQQNKLLLPPEDPSGKRCSPLPVWTDGEECISCWKLSLFERVKILITGRIWLFVLSGETQPPVFIGHKAFKR